jgi:hypothetical protein
MKPPAVTRRELQNRKAFLKLLLCLPGNFRILSSPANGKLSGGLKSKVPVGQFEGHTNVIDKDYPVFVRGFVHDVADEMDPASLPRRPWERALKGGPDAFVSIGYNKLYAAKAPF